MISSVSAAIAELVLANHILAHERLLDAYGHVSIRHPEASDRFLLSCSRSPELVAADDIMTFDLAGDAIGGGARKPYAERFIHAAIYAARPDVCAILHTHGLPLIPFSVSSQALRPIFHMAAAMGRAPVWDIADEFGETNMLVTTLDQGRSLARTLGNGRAALMRGHGSVVAARDVREAVVIALYMNANAEAQSAALALDGNPRFLSDGEIEQAAAMVLSELSLARAWESWRSRIGQPPISAGAAG